VTVWDETGQASHSDPAWFEMGLLERSDWQGEWIGAALTGGPRSTIPAPFLRQSFQLDGATKTARLYVTALGLHECSINGQPVSKDVFAPGWTDYGNRVQYQVYDVTGLLHQGENVIGAILGDGWIPIPFPLVPRCGIYDEELSLQFVEKTLPPTLKPRRFCARIVRK
jgi:alpha-L-rhamnosidase